MAQPARKPTALPDAAPAQPAARPQLRPRALREAETGAQAHASSPNEPLRLQNRIVAAFTARGDGTLEKTLMRLIIVAATCLIAMSATGPGGVLAGLLR